VLGVGRFLYNNYKQALAIISEYGPEIEHFKAIHSLEDADFERWHTEELEYLESAHTESVTDIAAITYVEALQNLEKAQ
jgi:hypothetical protein